ncbi:hypothetical protein F4808DRAFT_454269 [Astrocystis sublimbata]|nr:hypothetical protein F4808DRAFT_454269 [Astrocystis sublimbata]
MDIAKYAVGPQSYDILSRAQISTFFASNPSVTRNQCDDLAAALLGGPIAATPIQGGNSYTVKREEASKYGLAQQIYFNFVPQCVYYGVLGALYIYVCDRVSGTAFCRVHFANIIRFFALAWNNRQTLELPLGLQHDYIATIDKLSPTLPDNLCPIIDTVKQDLYILFRPDFPIALYGYISGVVDWYDAFIAPFGLSLGGMEIFLGVQTNKNWHLHPFHLSLRQQFWDTFYSMIGQVSELDRRLIEVARLMGLLRAYGFERNGMSNVYLERLVLL